MLQAHVWDLRTQVEAQLRTLTGVQQLLDTMPEDGVDRSTRKQQVAQVLTELMKANATISDLSAAALDVARVI